MGIRFQNKHVNPGRKFSQLNKEFLKAMRAKVTKASDWLRERVGGHMIVTWYFIGESGACEPPSAYPACCYLDSSN